MLTYPCIVLFIFRMANRPKGLAGRPEAMCGSGLGEDGDLTANRQSASGVGKAGCAEAIGSVETETKAAGSAQ